MLRSAGSGDRARLLLGFDEGRTVVLKVSDAADPAAYVEIEALDRGAGEHVVGLEDVSADGRAIVLVLERLARGTLAELLDRRGAIDVGEAVTILAPLAATVERLHAAGVAHTALSPTAVCFRDDGAPALTGFGAAELFAAGSPEVVRETLPGVVADRTALRGIAATVLGHVAGERSAAALRLAANLDTLAPDDLGRALFDLADPVPIRVDAAPAALDRARVGEPLDPSPREEEPRRALPPWLVALLPDGIRDRVPDAVDRVRAVWAGWSPGRRRLALALGAAGLTVVTAVALLPAGPGGATSARPASAAPAAGAPEGGLSEGGVPEDGLPDDPVEAAVVLLETRERCLRDLSLLCLDDVVQAGSAAYADDAGLIRAIRGGGEYPGDAIVAGPPVLVERLGDSALLDLPAGSRPASLLLLRTTDGWRIRQYLADQDGQAPAATTSVGQMPSFAAKSPPSRRALTAPRKRAASAPSTIRWSYDRAR